MYNSLNYCFDTQLVLGRLEKLYSQRSPIICAKMNVPNRALEEFKKNHKEGFCDYPDIQERVKFWDSFTRERLSVHDDSIPGVPLKEMDQGLYGGLFGGDVRFLCDTSRGMFSSMVYPVIKDLSEVDGLCLDESCMWFQRYTSQIEAFLVGGKGNFSINHLMSINGLNFVFELIGATATYMACEEQPELVKRAIELAFEVNLKIQKTFFEKVPLLNNGTCSCFAQWLPGRIVSESVDPFHMTSVDYFEKWGRSSVERLFCEFDGGIIHIHGNGRHLFKAASSIKGLKAIFLGDDTGYPLSFDILDEIREQVGDMPLICLVDFHKFNQKLKEKKLLPTVFYNVLNVPNVDEANRCMDVVRNYIL